MIAWLRGAMLRLPRIGRCGFGRGCAMAGLTSREPNVLFDAEFARLYDNGIPHFHKGAIHKRS